MHRALTVAVVLAVVAGSVPAAASLADGTPSTPEPGASFAGVIGVQGAEVNNEVTNRSLNRQLRGAESNRSKARIVASESQQLEERLAELETEKERLHTAYENGSISKGKYTAQLAVVAVELRAIERRANRTAGVAEQLPADALRETGANASRIRGIAQHANRTGGGAVAEAAREIAGGSVGNGLGGPPSHAGPPNGSESGPPDSVGNVASNDGPATGGNEPSTNAGNATNQPAGPPSDVGNGSSPANVGNGNSAGDAPNATDIGNRSNAENGEGVGNGVPSVSSGTGNTDNGHQNETATDDASAGRPTIALG